MSAERDTLEAAIAAVEAQRLVLGDAVVEASLDALRRRLAALDGPAPGEQALRQVSILFLDVVGSTALSQKLDPEEVSAVMDGALSRGTTIVQDHGGRVLKYAGDNILAAFGVDEAAEDDAERAVHCGLALIELGEALGAEVLTAFGHDGFNVRVGIHTGVVLLGGGVDGDATIRGSSVNIAARMEQTSPPGRLRISHDTYVLVRGAFDVEAQQPLTVKGVDDPVRSFLVLRAKPRALRSIARGIVGVETRMIGRDTELEALMAAFERMLSSDTGLQSVIVVADAGMGKTRLLREFRSWADRRSERFTLLQARATPRSLGQPYGVMRDLFAGYCRIHDSDSMEAAKHKFEHTLAALFADEGKQAARAHAHLLGQLIGLDFAESPHLCHILDDARQIRSRAFSTAAQALRRISTQGDPPRHGMPIMMQIEDLHWADDGSLDFIDYLAEVDHDVSILLLALTRPTLFERHSRMEQSGALRIDLAPLDKVASRMLADELLNKLLEVPAAVRELVTDRADGNPFYMEELVAMLIDQGAIRMAGERWSLDADRLHALEVPPTLTGVLQARLDGLPRQERHTLQLASVIGLHFWDRVLTHIEQKAAEQLPALQHRDLVSPQDVDDALWGDRDDEVREFAFRQQILQQVTYGTVLKATRRTAHAKTAQWLVQHGEARSNNLLGVAAWHFEQAGDTTNAAEYYARAAGQAAATFLHDTALNYATRALELAPPDVIALRWQILAMRERTLDMLGRRDEQLRDVEALLALADAMPRGADGDAHRADAVLRRCDLAMRTGDWPAQEREARRAVALAEGAGAGELALRATQRLAQALAFSGDPAAGLEVARAGLAQAEARGSLASQSRLVNAMAVCAAELGDAVGALRYSLVDLSISRKAEHRVNEAIGLSNVGVAYLKFGDHARARQHLEDALTLSRTLGSRELEGSILGAMSDLALRDGDAVLSVARAHASLDILTAVGSRIHMTDTLLSLGDAELALGRFTAAKTAFDRCEALAREIGLSDDVLAALAGQARSALAAAPEGGIGVGKATQIVEQLVAEACGGEPVDALADAFEGIEHGHHIRLTIYRTWARAGDSRAEAALRAAFSALMREADRINDVDLRASFLSQIPGHREIVALGSQQQQQQPPDR